MELYAEMAGIEDGQDSLGSMFDGFLLGLEEK